MQHKCEAYTKTIIKNMKTTSKLILNYKTQLKNDVVVIYVLKHGVQPKY